jgi:hypothetical protein
MCVMFPAKILATHNNYPPVFVMMKVLDKDLVSKTIKGVSWCDLTGDNLLWWLTWNVSKILMEIIIEERKFSGHVHATSSAKLMSWCFEAWVSQVDVLLVTSSCIIDPNIVSTWMRICCDDCSEVWRCQLITGNVLDCLFSSHNGSTKQSIFYVLNERKKKLRDDNSFWTWHIIRKIIELFHTQSTLSLSMVSVFAKALTAA